MRIFIFVSLIFSLLSCKKENEFGSYNNYGCELLKQELINNQTLIIINTNKLDSVYNDPNEYVKTTNYLIELQNKQLYVKTKLYNIGCN